MRRWGLPFLLLPLLAGCGLSDGAADTAATEAGQPDVVWRTELAGEIIEVELTDPNGHYRVQRVELIAPGGRSYDAREVTREIVQEDAGGYSGPGGIGVGLGGGFGSRGRTSIGMGFSFPLFGSGIGRRPASVTRTTARIPLPDPAAYRETVEDWKIKVHLVDAAGNESFAELPAPRPS